MRIVLLCNQPVHGAGAFGLFGIVNGADLDAAFFFEIR
jgi:hypothetical protein